MSIRPDRWIREMCRKHAMIEPFEEKQVRGGVISYGVSSYGYDVRIADEFKIFTNLNSTVVDPKKMDPASMVDFKGPIAIIPPNSFALGRTIEYFRIPRNVMTITVGKCVTGDTRVVDADTGDFMRIRDFVDRRGSSVAAFRQGAIRTAEVSDRIHNGRQPVFLLRTRAGLELKATAFHPLKTFGGWKPLVALAPGERIAAAREIPHFGTGDLPAHEATLLGLLLADGQCHTPGSCPRYTTSDSTLARVFEEAAARFGGAVSPVGRFGYNLVNHRGRGGVPAPNRAAQWLRQLGCAVLSADKQVPSRVFTAKRELVALFLRALFSGDGSVYRSGQGAFLEYTSISKVLVHDVRHLLLRFGVFGLIREKELSTGGKAYRVQITDKDMIRRFAAEIGFVPGSRKQAALEETLDHIVAFPRRKSNFDNYPPEVWGLMRAASHRSGRSLRSLNVLGTAPSQPVPKEMAERVAVACADPELQEALPQGVLWDRVESIVPLGEEEVYDLSVPGAHNFVANDLVVHNSTYARCGIITNVTPFEPEWEGHVTLEVSNTTPLPAKIYANEGIAQVLFFESSEPCEVSYKDRSGKYQAQRGITLPKV